jgi:phage-related protein
MYQGETSSSFWKEFFTELNQLNIVSKDQSFKKNVLLEIGADAAVTLVEFIASKMTAIGGPVVGILSISVKEIAIRIIYFAKLTGRYVLYRFAFKTVHGSTHIVNEHIYKLTETN